MSFEALMLPHLDAAHNLAKWLLRNEQDAQDVVQEAFLRAFKSFSGFHGSNGRAWLLTIVRNTSYTFLKKNRAVDLTTAFDEEIHAIDHESVSPAAILEHAEDAELITKAVDELPAEFREILILRHQEGLSYKEIGEIVKIPPGTVMSRLARARAKVKECLAARVGNENEMMPSSIIGPCPTLATANCRPLSGFSKGKSCIVDGGQSSGCGIKR